MRAMGEHAGTVAALWRYPVKSLRGERLEALPLEPRGPVGDRLWALVDEDGKIASGKNSRRFRRVPDLLRHASRCDRGVPVLELADGRAVRADEPALAAAVAAQAGLAHRPRVLKGIGRANEACAGVYAEVLTPGTVRADDPARLLP